MKKLFWLVPALALMTAPGAALAGVSEEEAERLEEGGDLTPWGAEKAGNEDGSIPAWDGGLTEIPDCYEGEGSWYCNPFPDDEPAYVITADNVDEYADLLSEGQKAMFETYPESYKMPVYETRRNFRNPEFIYEGTRRNATEANLGGGGEALEGAINGYPFPIPKSGHEVIWNHKTRYLGRWVQRWNNQFAVTQNGRYNRVTIREDVYFPYNFPGNEPEDLDNVLIYFLQVVTEPPRLAGTITLVHETMDQVKEPRRAWQYNPGQRRLRRAPNVAYDNPGTASDGLRTNDQTDTFNGAMDRYTWKLVGKKEMLVPANSYPLHNQDLSYDDIVTSGHINQDHTRYERRRVWIVDAETKPGTTHIYKRRKFYVDEDGWQIRLVDIYDRRDELWRFQEAHTVLAYDKPFQVPIGETIYDLQNGRYLVQALNNEHPENVEREFDADYFKPSNVSRQATR
ncbi:DUF1329 domain-containing protein [Algiphilus aromaticivorans]|uniref:DUF1329 domain-containing protein n=1 Tax=Algiphilus aromaticivorans TaxID=382454 RepID=UPI0018DDB45D|nr:DUF1329 domain-containing protein [Algiphilus aromaticivorans]